MTEPYINQNPKCEPHLGKLGLYREIGDNEMAMLWVLTLSDGEHSLRDISDRAELRFDAVRRAANLLREHGLLEESR